MCVSKMTFDHGGMLNLDVMRLRLGSNALFR